MKIDPTRPQDVHSKAAESALERDGSARPAVSTPVERTDQVEISDEGRALASEAESQALQTQPLTPARIDDIRAKLESGHYDRPEIIEEITERIADSGDL